MDDTAMIDEWQRYGRALVGSMAEVLEEIGQESHPVVLETADYWLALGLAIGMEWPDQAARLLELIEALEGGRAELAHDGRAFVEAVLE